MKILFFLTDIDCVYKRCRNSTKNFSKISNLNFPSFIEEKKLFIPCQVVSFNKKLGLPSDPNGAAY